MKFIVSNIIFCLTLCNPALAEYILPSAVNVSTQKYVPKHSDFNYGDYVYKVSWQGIPVATAKIHVNNPEAEGSWKVNANAKTSKWISTFYTLQFESESTFSHDDFKPQKFASRQIENSKRKVKEVTFLDNGTITANAYKNGKKEETITFTSENQTLDPISAAFLARSLDIKVGSKKSFDIFNGKHRYLITFNVEGLEKIKIGKDKEVECYSVRPDVVKLTDTEGEKRLSSARIWITADDKREILKIESKVLVGSIKAEFQKFTADNNVTLVKVH